jgi:hypothetical protein
MQGFLSNVRVALSGGLFTAIALAGCAVGAAGESSSVDDAERAIANRDAALVLDDSAKAGDFYIVTRPDYRKCMYPLCGGWFVQQVNQADTACADGAKSEDCYVSDLDFDALGLDEATLAELSGATKQGHALVRGHLVAQDTQFGVIGQLVATEGWVGQAQVTPTGSFYGVQNTGIVCVTYPCPTIGQWLLNTTDQDNIAGFDITETGASKESIEAAQAALALKGGTILVAGTHETITGPAGEGKSLTASEFYLKANAAKPDEPCGDNTCGAGEYCCNASCGICAPEGGACIQIACEPLCHDVCEEGDALATTCGDCAATVCAADPYCCNTAWDGICVSEAAQLCGACEPEPEPESCPHSECSAGSALDASCSSCADAVCAADPFCCDVKWDGLCVKQAQQSCATCEPGPQNCSHTACDKGPALAESCSPCAAAVCAQDPFCCATKWDNLCVSEANQLCGAECG